MRPELCASIYRGGAEPAEVTWGWVGGKLKSQQQVEDLSSRK